MFKLLKNLKTKDYIIMAISVCLVVATVYFELLLPDFMSDITVLIQTEGSDINEILIAGAKMLGCALGSAALAMCTGYLSAKIAANLAMNTRDSLYKKVQNFSKAELKRFSTNSLLTRSTNDISQVQMFIAMGLILLIKAPVTAIWAVFKILGKGWEWSLATAIAVGILIIAVVIIAILVIPKFKRIQLLTDSLNRVSRENLTGVRVVRAYNAEEYETAKFDKVNTDLTKTNMFTTKTMAVLMPIIMLIMCGLSLAIYWIGAYILNDAAAADKVVIFGNMIVFINYAMQVIMSFMMLIIVFIMLPRAMVSAKRINEVLDTKNSMTEATGKVETTEVGTIEFRNVNFKYPDASEYVLKNINLKVEKGKTLAIIGATGSGKTTAVQLMARIYDTTEGEVLIDGVNIKDIPSSELHSKVAFVPQRAELFSGTIESNIAFGETDAGKIDQASVKEAMEIADVSEFASKLPLNEKSPITQGGSNVSGGQKQRISLARAIARKPEIIIFDDSFSALDFKTDRKVREQIATKLKGTTCIIVAQRVGTIMNADKILVLEDGEIVGEGTHKELLKTNEVYKEIALSQLSEEEL